MFCPSHPVAFDMTPRSGLTMYRNLFAGEGKSISDFQSQMETPLPNLGLFHIVFGHCTILRSSTLSQAVF